MTAFRSGNVCCATGLAARPGPARAGRQAPLARQADPLAGLVARPGYARALPNRRPAGAHPSRPALACFARRADAALRISSVAARNAGAAWAK
ncbi:hypothetical protein TPA0909_05330 [Streptomyces albus]|nr:hypothetical protein TPA0909_05330 [Streptomyces albus]